MTIAALVYALVFGALVAAAAAALDACCRLGKRATRGVWVAALGVTVVGMALAPQRAVSPRLAAVAPVAMSAAAPHPPSFADRVVQSMEMVRVTALRIFERALARIPAARLQSADRWLTVGWAAVSLAALVLLIAVHAHFRRARRAWPVATVEGTNVRLAPRTGPAVIGVIAPEIVVPAWLLTRANVEQRLVLDHEREHLRARDPLVLSAAYVAAALMPWHPAVWWMLARLRLAVEVDCDARVLQRGAPAGSYGELLINLAGRGAGPAGVPVLGLTLTNLERRLIAMTQHRRPQSNARRALLAATAVVALAIACNAPVPTSPHQDFSRDVPLTAATNGLLTPGDTVVYRIDGLLSTELLASKLQADSVRVVGDGRYKVTLDPVDQKVRQRVEYWLTSVLAKERAAFVRPDGHAAGAVDPSEALREKMQVDSAMRATMIQAKRKQSFTGRVVVDGQPSTMLYLKQLSPDLIKSIDVMKHADSTSVLSVITKDH